MTSRILGRESVFHFDEVILSCLEANAEIAAYTHKNELTDLQKAACQIVPQGINLALSIRELVRQGYLFAAAVLIRPLIEQRLSFHTFMRNPKKSLYGGMVGNMGSVPVLHNNAGNNEQRGGYRASPESV